MYVRGMMQTCVLSRWCKDALFLWLFLISYLDVLGIVWVTVAHSAKSQKSNRKTTLQMLQLLPSELEVVNVWVTDKIWYTAKGHPKVGCPIGFAVAAPCTNLPEGILLGIVLGWAPIGFAAMATPQPSQYYFRLVIPNFVRYSFVCKLWEVQFAISFACALEPVWKEIFQLFFGQTCHHLAKGTIC